MPYSPRLALRVGEGQSWVKCLVQEHNVAAASSDAVGIRIADPLDHKFRMLPLAPLRLTYIYIYIYTHTHTNLSSIPVCRSPGSCGLECHMHPGEISSRLQLVARLASSLLVVTSPYAQTCQEYGTVRTGSIDFLSSPPPASAGSYPGNFNTMQTRSRVRRTRGTAPPGLQQLSGK